ncbi:hypothetical protein A7P53_15595 [Acinetobacter defluvii]|uniref:hypothetical protein n=1 Tax=Acinetobacter defluvii TaxID=1871111 RepID=UPI001490698B|nr:hypothetical protein [Acinetobacter defluvii]NNP74081.1 hypothetical protein [Acinetobacter defluvii]
MNVSVQQHQRSLLAAMGIDVWVPKLDVPVRHMQSQLYRDSAAPENVSEAVISDLLQTELVITEDIPAQQQPEQRSIQVKVGSIQHAEVLSEKQPINSPTEPIEIKNLAAFELQAICLKSCVIVIDATQISTEQQKLWFNIQNAMISEYFELKWPFPVTQFQDGRGVHMYIQGFLDALKHDKVIITLGEIAHLKNTDAIQLASLQEMLAQPKLKRRLWKFMQKSSVN